MFAHAYRVPRFRHEITAEPVQRWPVTNVETVMQHHRRVVHPRFVLLACWCFALGILAAPSTAQVEIRHLGNEGFLLAAEGHKVLIDALFGDGLEGYPVVPEELRRRMESATDEFSDVDLVLASHLHDDHFDAEAVAKHLRANGDAHVVSTPQVVEALREVGLDGARSTAFWPTAERSESHVHRGIRVTALRFHHGRSEAQNLGLLVELGGLRILHLGDTAVTADELPGLPLDDLDLDIVMVPYWQMEFSSWPRFRDHLAPRHWIAMHFPTADAPKNYFGARRNLTGQVQACRAAAPDAWMAYRSGDSRRFEPAQSRRPQPTTDSPSP